MSKKSKPSRPRNPYAKALKSPHLRPRVVKDKKKQAEAKKKAARKKQDVDLIST